MSTEIENLKKQISIIKQLIIIYQKLLTLLKNETLVVIHWTATPRRTTYESINSQHKIRKYPRSSLGHYCAYNTVITEDGRPHFARTKMETGHGVGILTQFHIDVCLTGMPEEPPNEKQIGSLMLELERIKSIHGKIKIRPHSYYINTQCPGNKLRAWIKGLK